MPTDSATGMRRFSLHAKQYDFVNNDLQWSFYIGGVGAGKSFAGAVRSLIWASRYPGSLGFIGAPTFPMLRDATQRSFFQVCPKESIATFNKNEQLLTLTNGSEIFFRSLDNPDRARGPNLTWFWLDEAPFCGYYAWEVLKGRVRDTRFPNAGWATGTPKGKDGYWEDFEGLRGEPKPGHALYRASTFDNAKNLPRDYVQSLGYTGSFYEQEVEGLFTAFEGLVYQFDPLVHIKEPPIRQWSSVYGAVDWGYRNPASALVFAHDSDQRVWQVAEFYKRQAPVDEHIAEIVSLSRVWNVEEWDCDPSEPEHIMRLNVALEDAGLSSYARGAANMLIPGIQSVSSALAMRGDGTRGYYVSPKCIHTIAEFGSYQYATKEKRERNLDEKPLKQSDHAMDCVRYHINSRIGRQMVIPIAVSGNSSQKGEKEKEPYQSEQENDQETWQRLAQGAASTAQFLQSLRQRVNTWGTEKDTNGTGGWM